MSKSLWSDKGRMNCSAGIAAISASAMAACGRSLPSWIRTPSPPPSPPCRETKTLKRGVYSLATPDRLRRYQHVLSILPGSQVDDLFQDGLLSSNSGDTILDCWRAWPTSWTGQTNWRAPVPRVRSTLPDELLMYADKLSRPTVSTLRVPFVDKEIVEYVERLPASLKVRHRLPEMAAPAGVPELSPRLDP